MPRRMLSLFRNLFRKEGVDKLLDEELRSSLEILAQEKIQEGMEPREARRQARIELGGMEQVKMKVREARFGTALETVWQDVRYALRMLRRSPGFTAVAVLTLALAIGANTAIFSVVDSVLLRPLPYPESDRMIRLYDRNMKFNAPRFSASVAHFYGWKEQSELFEGIGAYRESGFNLLVNGEPVRVGGVRMTAGVFPVIGLEPIRGRWFTAEEDQLGAAKVAVISSRLWQRQFGGDPDIVGNGIAIDGEAHTVVGVMPPEFEFPQRRNVDVMVPYALTRDRGGHFLRVLGRLKPEASIERSQAEMNTIAERLDPDQSWEVFLLPLLQGTVGGIQNALLILFLATGFVLLIACSNVANLLLSRGSAREKEIAVRGALGASRARIFRQLLTESAVLALVGGGVGVLLAWWGVQALLAFGPRNLPRQSEIVLDGEVLLFALAVSVLTGALFGVIPAIGSARAELHDSLKEGGRQGTGKAKHRVRNLLVVAEVALALMLLIGASLFVQSFRNQLQVDPGFAAQNILTFSINPLEAKYSSLDQKATVLRQVWQEVTALPGVEAAGYVHRLPFSGQSVHSLVVQGRPIPSRDQFPSVTYYSFSPGYLEALQIPLLRGRHPTEDETFNGQSVVVINQALADTYFKDESPLGHRLLFGPFENPIWLEIVGVVGNARVANLSGAYLPVIYFPYRSYAWPSMVMTVRTAADPAGFAEVIREKVRQVDPAQPIGSVQTMEQYLSNLMAVNRFNTQLIGLFALVAMLLATVGIYGVITYTVSQRTHEFGLRMALGAQPRDILKLVVGQGMHLTLIGIGVGLAGAFALTRFLESLLFGVTPTDPATFAGVAFLLAAVALLACYIPARRATRVAPMVALRYE